ncbi:glycosyltransferase [Nocardioides sp. BP30]|uniref:glycosyltransferase n=1 Tax=Nocardioides sp. BP30 TaxID=3036374 RepID=UPI002468D6FE|nr:glycosyltransferase [Nocardioides sp. BP30]WGL51922.1 glycosyltransferase [Nocardioides sp. BP30]
MIIARDESRSIVRCLDSLRDHVDEVLLLDTGSTDGTVALASAHGARVEHFTWVDDFAAARNAALAAATGDWRLVVDADEWLAEGAEELSALRAGRLPSAAGAVVQRNDQTNGQQSTAWLPRLLPRGVRYEGRIHEQPVLSSPAVRTGIVLGHDGYLREQLAVKAERNRALLEAALAADPADVYLRYQLGKDHEVHRRYVEAAQHYDLAYAATPLDAPWRHDLIVRHLFTLSQAGRSGDALDVADAELPRWTHSADFFFVVGDVLLTHAAENPAHAARLLPLAEDAWSRCLELGDTPDLPGAVAGRGSHLAAHNLKVLRGEI